MKKKDVIISIIIAFILSFVMIFFSLSKKDNVIIEKSTSSDKKIIEDSTEQTDVVKSKDENSTLVVYVSGAVKTPQVVKMKNGDRLIDAVEKCGGMAKDADTNAINLALLLKDEGHYIIPKIGENIINASSSNISSADNTSSNNNTLININTADKNALESLPSVGEKTAERIIQYREKNGQFKSIEDLKNVSGIGDKKYEQIKDMITVN